MLQHADDEVCGAFPLGGCHKRGALRAVASVPRRARVLYTGQLGRDPGGRRMVSTEREIRGL